MSHQHHKKKKNKSSKNPFQELVFNILIPTLILNKGAKYLGPNGPMLSLILALLFPLCYSIYDFYKQKSINFFGVVGFISIVATGGLALMKAEGSTMVWKETIFPLTLGLIVLITAFKGKPLLSAFILNPQIMDTDLLHKKLQEHHLHPQFNKHLKFSTMLFSASFLFSALLNYILASRIFINIPTDLTEAMRSQKLNEQIANMTFWSWFVILIPSLIFLAVVMMYFFRGIKEMTGLELKDLMKDHPKEVTQGLDETSSKPTEEQQP